MTATILSDSLASQERSQDAPTVIGSATLHRGDCIEVMRSLPDSSVDSVVTDPPYGIRFMGKSWDGADIEARAARRRSFASHAPDAGPNGGHKSIAAEAGKYDLAPAAMRAFQEFSEEWAREAFRVLKPGGHLLSFSSARTYHRMACGIEDAGFEVRDQALWLYGSGFPKSLNVSKMIDKMAGAEREVVSEGKAVKRMIPGADQDATGSWIKDNGREYVPQVTLAATEAAAQWEGWGTALKPSHEPICVARKPLIGTVVANVLQFGTGALNIAACRVAPTGESRERTGEVSRDLRYTGAGTTNFAATPGARGGAPEGRWPANLMHDGSDEVLAAFPDAKGQQGDLKEAGRPRPSSGRFGDTAPPLAHAARIDDSTSAARFFYCAKASRADRNAGLADPGPQFKHGATLRKVENTDTAGNTHPTVKPTDLMAYLCRLVTPPGGVVLDPFMGSGSTGKAAMREDFQFIGIELEPEYLAIASARIAHEIKAVATRAAAVVERAAAVAEQQRVAAQQTTIFELDGI